MEGAEFEDNSNEGEQLDTGEIKEEAVEDTEEGIEEIPKDKSRKRKINTMLPIALLLIGIIIGNITYPFISNLLEDKPIYQQYTTIKGENTVAWKNEELNVTITKHIINSEDYYGAEWIRIDGMEFHSYACGTPSECLDGVLNYAEELTINQLRWYQYMLKNVVK